MKWHRFPKSPVFPPGHKWQLKKRGDGYESATSSTLPGDAWGDATFADEFDGGGVTNPTVIHDPARGFYRTFRRLTGLDLAVESGDFRLMDRRPLDALLAMPERNRFLRGMTVWVGYTQTAVTFEREARTAGRTKYSLGRMVRFSFDAITSFSHRPLQFATLLGFAFSALAFLAIPLTVVARYTNIYERGVPSVIVVVLLLGGIQLICVGIIGEYVGRIYDEVKHRPLYVVRDKTNLDR